MKLENLLDTDPLTLMALAGFASVLIVTIALFGFLFTRRIEKR